MRVGVGRRLPIAPGPPRATLTPCVATRIYTLYRRHQNTRYIPSKIIACFYDIFLRIFSWSLVMIQDLVSMCQVFTNTRIWVLWKELFKFLLFTATPTPTYIQSTEKSQPGCQSILSYLVSILNIRYISSYISQLLGQHVKFPPYCMCKKKTHFINSFDFRFLPTKSNKK